MGTDALGGVRNTQEGIQSKHILQEVQSNPPEEIDIELDDDDDYSDNYDEDD